MTLAKHIEKTILENKEKWAFFVYDMIKMKAQLDLLSVLPENVHTYYAMKANPHQEVIKTA